MISSSLTQIKDALMAHSRHLWLWKSFNAIIKKELVNHTHYETFDQTHACVAYMSILNSYMSLFIERWYTTM